MKNKWQKQKCRGEGLLTVPEHDVTDKIKGITSGVRCQGSGKEGYILEQGGNKKLKCGICDFSTWIVQRGRRVT